MAENPGRVQRLNPLVTGIRPRCDRPLGPGNRRDIADRSLTFLVPR